MRQYTIGFIFLSILFLGCDNNGTVRLNQLGSGPTAETTIKSVSIGTFVTSEYTTPFSIEATVMTTQIEVSIPNFTEQTVIEARIELAENAYFSYSGNNELVEQKGPIISLDTLTIRKIMEDDSARFIVKNNGYMHEYSVSIVEYVPYVEEIPVYARANFDYVRNNVGKNYVLVNHIKLVEEFDQIAPDTDANNGSFDGIAFSGTFDGNHKTIYNLWIAKSEQDYIGMFGKVVGTVKNLRVLLRENDSITGRYRVAGLVGESDGIIENVGVIGGIIQAEEGYVGGLVGYVEGGSISKSYATGVVDGPWGYAGGLVGTVGGGTVSDSYATGSVSGGYNVGGLMGAISSGEVRRGYATGMVKADYNLGGLVGAIWGDGSIVDSYFDAVLTAQSEGIARGSGGTVAYFTDTADKNVVKDADPLSFPNALAIAENHFQNWDFAMIWKIQPGQWPTLR